MSQTRLLTASPELFGAMKCSFPIMGMQLFLSKKHQL